MGVVELHEVSKRFGDSTAVDRVSVTVEAGEFFSMLGPSGCGKTTTLRLVAGFEEPTSGRVVIDGRDVAKVSPHRRPVNTVFQHYALFPHMNVFDNVAYGPRSRRVDATLVAARVERALEVVRLQGLGRRRTRQLSGGEQQRVALARALVNEPRALLLDEPLGALDLQLRRQMQGELKSIQRDAGIAFLYVTHDQEEALAMSDRIAVMREGRIEQVGTPVEVYERPDTLFVAGFLGTATFLEGVVDDRGPEWTVLDVPGVGRVVAPTVPATGRTATLVLRPERIRLGSVPEGPNAVATRVVESVFEGPSVRVTLRTHTGIAVVARVEAREAGVHAPGDRAWAMWAPEDGRLLCDTAPGRAPAETGVA